MDMQNDIKAAHLSNDSMSPKNALVSIQPETESDTTAALVLWRMYMRYAALRGWTIEHLAGFDDFKHATFLVRGKGACGRLKYEAGLHAFQHRSMKPIGKHPCSTVNVSVLPEIDDEFEIALTDILMWTCRVPGPAGEGAHCHVRLAHVPTGLTVWFRNNESFRRKKQIALSVLKALLWKQEAARRSDAPVQTEQRPALIRTYDERRKTVTDHRLSAAHLPLATVLGGELDALIDQISSSDQEEPA
jgi:peptide chain release factor 1